MKLSAAQKSARKMVGDGKSPNMYWVSGSVDWLTNKSGSDGYDWASDHYKLPKVKSELFGPFDTFEEAKAKAQEIADECAQPDELLESLHSVQIEDRLTGTLYEGVWVETWEKRQYLTETVSEVSVDWEWMDDTSFTVETMQKRGETFV
jgi:hypothetical protein